MTAKKNDAKTNEPGETISFEKAMDRLEKIVGDMETGELSLDDMIVRFEEGQGLIKFCNRTLNEVERKIEILVKKGDERVAEPFEPETDGAPAPAAGKKQSEDDGLPF